MKSAVLRRVIAAETGQLVVAGEKQVAMDKGTEFIRISGTVNPDTIGAGDGADTVDGGDGVSYLRGDAGNDQVAGGADYGSALDAAGRVLSWGYNSGGELADGSTSSRSADEVLEGLLDKK